MVSLLESRLKKSLASAFKGRLTRGTLRRVASTTVDAAGDLVPGAASSFTFEGIRESFDARYRAQAGIPENDVQILILLGSIKPATTPRQEDQIFLSTPWSKWHKIRQVLSVDPAGASGSYQCYEIEDPT